MKLLEIHKNGINAHNKKSSFYGVDFQTKSLVFENTKNLELAISAANNLGYSKSEIQLMF